MVVDGDNIVTSMQSFRHGVCVAHPKNGRDIIYFFCMIKLFFVVKTKNFGAKIA